MIGNRLIKVAGAIVLAGALATVVPMALSEYEVAASSFTPVPPVLPANITPVLDTSTLRLPLDSFSATAVQQVKISRAVVVLAATCERRFAVSNTNPGTVEPVSIDNSRRYGVTSDAQVATWGYHAPNSLSGATDSKDAPDGWHPNRLEALVAYGNGSGAASLRDDAGVGLPSGGCYGEAWSKLADGQVVDPDLVDNLAQQASTLTESDARVISAFARWSDCMDVAGFAYATPWAANDAGWDMSKPASALEIATARADVECRTSTNLVGVWSAVERGYQEELISYHRSDLDRIANQLSAQESAADRVLALGT